MNDQNPYQSPDLAHENVRHNLSGTRLLGWLYLAVFGLDPILSAIALRAPDFEFAAHSVGTTNVIFSVFVFFMAVYGKLKPKALFLALAGLQFVGIVVGLGMGIYVGLQLGPQEIQNVELNIDFMRQHVPFFDSMTLAFCAIWLGAAIYGSLVYARSKDSQTPPSIPVASDEGERTG